MPEGSCGMPSSANKATPGDLAEDSYIVSLKYMEYGFRYTIIRSPYTPYSIYLRGIIGFRGLFTGFTEGIYGYAGTNRVWGVEIWVSGF